MAFKRCFKSEEALKTTSQKKRRLTGSWSLQGGIHSTAVNNPSFQTSYRPQVVEHIQVSGQLMHHRHASTWASTCVNVSVKVCQCGCMQGT